MDWTERVSRAPLEWLLQPENPSVRALALTELLNRDADDKEVVDARQRIGNAPYTARIPADQQPDGHWGAPERYFQKHTGTAWRWLLLLTRLGYRDPRMEDAIAYLQKKQSKAGAWKLQRTYNERSKHDTFPVVVPLDERGAPSKWVTLRALIVLKRWFSA